MDGITSRMPRIVACAIAGIGCDGKRRRGRQQPLGQDASPRRQAKAPSAEGLWSSRPVERPPNGAPAMERPSA